MGTHQDQLRGFAEYNRTFNRRLYEVAAELPDEVRKQDRGAFFGSVHATLNHILLADRVWLGRFSTVFPALASLQGAEVLHGFGSLADELYADFDALRRARAETDDVLVAWVEELDETLLAQTMRYRMSSGRERVHPAWVAAAHLFNHQTHHRGQITTLLYQLGKDPGVTDFIAYVHATAA